MCDMYWNGKEMSEIRGIEGFDLIVFGLVDLLRLLPESVEDDFFFW